MGFLSLLSPFGTPDPVPPIRSRGGVGAPSCTHGAGHEGEAPRVPIIVIDPDARRPSVAETDVTGGSRRAVVTGGAGFLGSWLCELLVAEGWRVVCVDNFLTGSPDNVAHLSDDPAFTLVECDVSRDWDVSGPVDLVLHLASAASPVSYLRHPVETMRAGSHGTLNALELARRQEARFLLASTS